MTDSNNNLREGGIVQTGATKEELEWLTSSVLSVVVVGASGDLAKKKTYPSLLNLFDDNLLPDHVRIYGFARSDLSDDGLRDRLRPYLLENGQHSPEVVEDFLQRCYYRAGKSYGDQDAFGALAQDVEDFEAAENSDDNDKKQLQLNRLFYLAIPPSAFGDAAVAIKMTGMQDEDKGWTRLIVEKPFGRDLQSFEELNRTLSRHFTEKHICK